MNRNDDVLLNFDKTSDILYVVRAGYDLNLLINMDSDKVPGLIKRIDSKSKQCVGFMIHSFSERFSTYKDCDEHALKALMDMSLRLTNESALPSEQAA